jgi:hypothetical protein
MASSLASASSITSTGTVSIRFACLACQSSTRHWLMTAAPWVCVPAPMSVTAQPATRSKLPCVMGATNARPRRLNSWLDRTSTGRVPWISLPKVGSRLMSSTSPCLGVLPAGFCTSPLTALRCPQAACLASFANQRAWAFSNYIAC